MEPQTTGGVPRIGDTAPDFTATTTQGEITFSDWQGDSWCLLFSHPADFTPVCSTELTEFARRSDEFAALNTKLIGLSIDSIHSHLAWRENLKSILDTEINYPLIADLDMQVAMKYGMLHPGESATATVRAVFVIDPNHVVRALVYYPLNVGRNIDEVKRLLVAPPKTEAEVAERATHPEYERSDFYLNKKSLDPAYQTA